MADNGIRIEALEKQMVTMRGNFDEALDCTWMIIAASLVFFMHSGFSLLEAGSVRVKNAQNILAKNLLVVTLGFLCWYVFGYPLAFGPFLEDFMEDKTLLRQWLFQGTFCATGGTIVSGAMAERTQLKGFGTFTIIMTSLIYPVAVHWAWSNRGFMSYYPDDQVGDRKLVSAFGPAYMDFAGSGIVHLIGGVAGLIGAAVVGPRKGRFQECHKSEFDSHNVPLCVLGTFFLWFGWYGFNPGSTLQMHTVQSAHTASLVAINTTLAPCVSGLTVFALRAFCVQPKLLDIGGFCNGILAGLVSITAGCAFYEPWESMVVAFIGGLLYQAGSMLLVRFQIDDVVDAVPVHGCSGLWAVIAVGLFGNPENGQGGNGLFYGGDQFRTQLMCVLIMISWVGTCSILIFLPLRLVGMLRMSDTFQDVGADIMEHTPDKAYTGQDHTSTSVFSGQENTGSKAFGGSPSEKAAAAASPSAPTVAA